MVRSKVSGNNAACGWSVVVKLDYDGDQDPWCVIYGSLVAELYVQRMIKRAEFWEFKESKFQYKENCVSGLRQVAECSSTPSVCAISFSQKF